GRFSPLELYFGWDDPSLSGPGMNLEPGHEEWVQPRRKHQLTERCDARFFAGARNRGALAWHLKGFDSLADRGVIRRAVGQLERAAARDSRGQGFAKLA